MLTFEQLSAELAQYTYRPGWTLTLWCDDFGRVLFYVVATVPDAYSPEKTTELRITAWVPPMQTPGQFAVWLAWRLREIEFHEAMEFFRRDGKPVFDPHAEPDPPPEAVRKAWGDRAKDMNRLVG